jgi:TonB-linked SusC/RagA family outer membrane protein
MRTTEMLRLRWMLMSALLITGCLFIADGVKAQNANDSKQEQVTRKISGTVVDTKGEPVIGASVLVKGTSTGTITDMNGKFSIAAKGNSTLVISFLGYTSKEVAVKDKATINVTLTESSMNMDEVVVVGYGTQKKASLVGSVSAVKADELEKVPTSNLSQALVGKLPGLITRQSSGAPGSDQVDFYVRGFTSLNYNAPLVLVDGVERSFSTIDPAEVESITILKDAAACAVYGVRGANGIVLVTTKRGVSSKPQLSYSMSYTLSQNTRMPEYLNGEEFVKWWNYADKINGHPTTFSDDVINKVTNGDSNGVFGNTDWVKLMLKSTAPTQHHNLTLNGGNESVKYFISLGYLDQQGIVKGVDYTRYNFRSNLDANINKQLSVSLNLGGNISNTDNPQISNFDANGNSVSTNLMNQIITAQPYIRPQNNNGDYISSSLLPGNNPLAARDKSGYNDTDNSAFQSSLTLKYDAPFLPGLSLKATGSYDKNYNHAKSYLTPYSLSVASTSTGSVTGTSAPYGSLNILSESYSQSSRWTLQQYITYNQKFGKNVVDALLLAEQSGYNYTNLYESVKDFDLNDLSEINYGKDWTTKPQGGSYVSHKAGWVGRVNYTFDNRYLAEISTRLDASTNFPANNRYGLFPSISAGWRVTEEPFFKNWNTPVTNLKLKVSYGILGNDATNGSYDYLSYMGLSTSPVAILGGSGANGLYSSPVYPNKNLTWETTTTYNAGFELEMWHGLLGAEFNWFYKINKDQLISASSTYPPSVGGYYPNTINSGKVDNRGFELVLTHKNTINKFNYSVTGSVSWAHNRILNMDQAADIPEYESMIGKSLGAKTGLIALGLFQSDQEALTSPVVNSAARAGDIKYKDINGDGKITYEQDVTIIGRSSMPELNYSLNFNSSWRDFEFSFLVQGAAICDNALMGWYDGIGWDDTQFTRTFYNNGNSPKYLIEGAWTPDNPNGKYPRLDNTWRPENNWASTMWIENGAYVRLKNVQIGYNLPDKICKTLGFKAKIYVAGSNLITISPFKYLDPEAPNVNNGYYPQQRTYSVGANITF